MKILLLFSVLFSTSALAQVSCNSGDFLFSDLSCGNVKEGKTIIGVVVDASKRVAVSLINSKKQWSNRMVNLEVSSPKGFSRYSQLALKQFGGQELITTFEVIAPNTYKAINYCASKDYIGSKAWFLPELGLLNLIYKNKSAINNSLLSIEKAEVVENEWYWSGSQYNYSQSWAQNFFTGEFDYIFNDKYNLVRCVINY